MAEVCLTRNLPAMAAKHAYLHGAGCDYLRADDGTVGWLPDRPQCGLEFVGVAKASEANARHVCSQFDCVDCRSSCPEIVSAEDAQFGWVGVLGSLALGDTYQGAWSVRAIPLSANRRRASCQLLGVECVAGEAEYSRLPGLPAGSVACPPE